MPLYHCNIDDKTNTKGTPISDFGTMSTQAEGIYSYKLSMSIQINRTRTSNMQTDNNKFTKIQLPNMQSTIRY